MIRYRYDIRASKKTFFLRNFRRIFIIFGDFLEFSALLLLLLGTLVHGFSKFSEFSEKFRNFWRIFGEKDKKITGFENIEILNIGGSIRYTLRYSEILDISAFDNFSVR